ncbi:MAG TPA: hypothetical protein VFZ66_27850 [Herpetosiphonaceae bacterium]
MGSRPCQNQPFQSYPPTGEGSFGTPKNPIGASAAARRISA